MVSSPHNPSVPLQSYVKTFRTFIAPTIYVAVLSLDCR
jgi:hypothetical protein